MKKMLCLGVLVALSLVVAGVAFVDASDKLALKVGDEVYVCNCGEGCDCLTMSRKETNCVCKKPLVKAKVTNVDKDSAIVQAPGWEKPRPFKTVGNMPVLVALPVIAAPSARSRATVPAASP